MVSEKQINGSYNYCAQPLAVYACIPEHSRGRQHEENSKSEYRSNFQRDKDRIIHSSAHRRLSGKTQVFVAHQNEFYRTRLTHTQEVVQIARTLARALHVNEDLTETVALAHDLGHPPFGHTGEDALDECMQAIGGFDHNDQSLRVLTMLERSYPEFYGLNLTWESLEGIVKHNGPLVTCDEDRAKLPVTIAGLDKVWDMELGRFSSVEAQIAALADDIAYNNHDVEDGLFAEFFTVDDLRDIALLKDIVKNTEEEYPDLDWEVKVHTIRREVIGLMVNDVLTEAHKRIAEINPKSQEDIRRASAPVIAFSSDMQQKVKQLRSFLFGRMYRSTKLDGTREQATKVVKDLYRTFADNAEALPEKWQRRVKNEGKGTQAGRERVVADYIASMTDQFATQEHERLCAQVTPVVN